MILMADFGIGSATDDRYVSVSSDERYWKNRMDKLITEHWDEVIVKHFPEDPSDYMTIWVPKEWVRIRPKRKMNVDPEEMKRRMEHVRNVSSESVNNSEENDDDLPFADLDEQVIDVGEDDGFWI